MNRANICLRGECRRRHRRPPMEFDLSSIAGNATITAATLAFSRSLVPAGTVTANMSLRHISRDSGEGASNVRGEQGGGAAPEAGTPRGPHFFNTTRWTANGGDLLRHRQRHHLGKRDRILLVERQRSHG